MLVHNYDHPNDILEDYRIEDMTLKNDFEMKSYAVVYKIQNHQFIILLRYIAHKLTTTITFILLNNISNKNYQTRSSTK